MCQASGASPPTPPAAPRVRFGLYLGHSTVGSAYGAAGSLVALLVWIYYSVNVFFFGAEFTQVWARRSGRRIEPEEGARRVREVTGTEEGDAEEEAAERKGAAYP